MQLWLYEESDHFTEAIQHDYSSLLNSFFSQYDLTFSHFKVRWKDLMMTEIHNLCPQRIQFEIFFQCLIQNGMRNNIILI
jgi:hypothetical protein